MDEDQVINYEFYIKTSNDCFGFSMEGDGSTYLSQAYIDILLCFNDVVMEEKGLTIPLVQKATIELKQKVIQLVEKYSKDNPTFYKLKTTITSLVDNEFFLVFLEKPESDMKSNISYECYINALNEVGVEDKEKLLERYNSLSSEVDEKLGDLVDTYDLINIKNDKKIVIGNKKKEERCCRFCSRTSEDKGTTFKSIAHAIPEALGNKTVILGDECDACNSFFGRGVEQDLINYLNMFRVFWRVQGKNGIPKLKSNDGYNSFEYDKDKNQINVIVEKFEHITDHEFFATVDLKTKFTPVNVYKALCKITLSTIHEAHISELNKTINWLTNTQAQHYPLPKIACIINNSGFSKEAKVKHYIRKIDLKELPHIVSEFRLGSLVFIYIIPFSNKDSYDFSNEKNYEVFWSKFKLYNTLNGWRFDHFDKIEEVVWDGVDIKLQQTPKKII